MLASHNCVSFSSTGELEVLLQNLPRILTMATLNQQQLILRSRCYPSLIVGTSAGLAQDQMDLWIDYPWNQSWKCYIFYQPSLCHKIILVGCKQFGVFQWGLPNYLLHIPDNWEFFNKYNVHSHIKWKVTEIHHFFIWVPISVVLVSPIFTVCALGHALGKKGVNWCLRYFYFSFMMVLVVVRHLV